MNQIDKIAQKVVEFESYVKPCNGRPKGDELPQSPTEGMIVLDLLHKSSDMPMKNIEAKLNNQIVD